VKNLGTVNDTIQMSSLITKIATRFKDTCDQSCSDDGAFANVDPVDVCPGLCEIEGHLRSWSWVFGRTPKFTVRRSFPHSEGTELTIAIRVFHGLIEVVDVEPSGVQFDLRDVPFTVDSVRDSLNQSMARGLSSDQALVVAGLILQTVKDVYR
jgi:hypothetical protein